MTILKKELNFKSLTVRTFLSSLIGGIVGIIAAFSGLGVYSLVIKSIVSALLGTALLWGATKWRPDFKFSLPEIKKLTGFSSYVFFDRALTRFFQQLDVLIVGKVFSPNMLGYYSRAISLRDLVTTYSSSSLTAVFYPVLSSLQNDDEEYSKVYFKVISVIAFISYGLTGVMCILGRDIIFLFFGPKWEPSVVIFQVIILMACNIPLNSMIANAFFSKGKSKENFRIGVLIKILRLPLLLVMYYLGMFAFTVSYVILNYVLTTINIFFLKKYTGLSYKSHFIKVFEGMLPLGIVLGAFFYFNVQTTFMRVVWAAGFSLTYLVFCKINGSEGLEFLLKNFDLIKKKIFKPKDGSQKSSSNA